MDRREALRKLAAGGAIAAGGSFVLSSNRVAYAASVGGVTGIPAPGEPLPIAYAIIDPLFQDSRIQVIDTTTPACVDASPVTTTHSWKINKFDVGGNVSRTWVELWDADNDTKIIEAQATSGGISQAVCGPGCTGYSSPTSFNGFTLKRWRDEIFGDEYVDWKNGDYYEVDTLISWSCAGHPTVQGEYRIAGTFPDTPTVTAL